MSHDLSDFRKSYEKGELIEQHCPSYPIDLFKDWFLEANDAPMIDEANAMSISSIGIDGFPKTRVVLLKKYTPEGFIFYTNYNSEKGKAILQNNKVCLSFFWAGLERQVIIKGNAEKVAEHMSDGYFKSRPYGSKLGAWASNQSEVIEGKQVLVTALEKFKQQYKDQDIPKPNHWGGFIVKPISIEFWQGRPNRLHDRIRYTLLKDFSWKLERLAP